MDPADTSLYFHAQCFDGVASAVISKAYLVERLGWQDPVLVPVSYGVQNEWLKLPFGPRTAVVDFLFHPEARFWADHHETTFLAAPPQHLDPLWFYDPKADSCAGMLARALPERGFYPTRFSHLTAWAEKIDAALYTSPEEAVFPRAAALLVNVSLIDASPDDCSALVRFLGNGSLEEAARLPSVSTRASAQMRRVEAGLAVVREAIRVDDGIAVFAVDVSADIVVHRYAPYLFAPQARYSAGLIRMPDRIRLTVMRNPWLEFESVHLGRLCARFGGGGHQRVGAATFPPTEFRRAMQAFAEVQKAMRAQSS